MLSPTQKIVNSLETLGKKVKSEGTNKWRAQCPCHDDKQASLSIGTGDDGRALIHDQAGCPTETVVAKLGLTMADLMPQRNGHHHVNGNTKAKRTWPELALAVAATKPAGHTLTEVYKYADVRGELYAAVARYDGATGKTIRPFARSADGWYCGDPQRWLPYRIDEAMKHETVYIHEGEKDTDAGWMLGLPSITSAHGAKSASKTDWSAVAGKTAVIIPDADAAGEAYAQDVATILHGLGCRVKIVTLPGLPEHGDIADWLEAQPDSISPDQLRDDILQLADLAPWWEPPASEPDTSSGATGAKPHDTAQKSAVTAAITCASDVTVKAIDWLWRDRIPLGMLTLLASRPGLGKTLLAVDIAARITTGREYPDGDIPPIGSVVFLDAENPLDSVLVPRLAAAGADLTRCHIITGLHTTTTNGKHIEQGITLGDLTAIEAAIDTVPDCVAVIIDPVGSYLGANTDAHRDNETRAVLQPLAELAKRKNIAVILVAHHRKQSSGFADDLVLGSRAFTGLCRISWHLSQDENDKKLMLLTLGKTNIGRRVDGWSFTIAGDPPAIQWQAPITQSADDALGDLPGKRGPEAESRDSAVEWLRELLKNGSKSAAEIEEEASAAGYSWSTIRRAKDVLKIVPTKFGYQGKWTWHLPMAAEGAQRCSSTT